MELVCDLMDPGRTTRSGKGGDFPVGGQKCAELAGLREIGWSLRRLRYAQLGP